MFEVELPEELQMLRSAVRRFVVEKVQPVSDLIEDTDKVPESILAEMGEMGLFGITIPEEYGGTGLGALAYCLVREELGGVNHSVTAPIGTSNGIGSKALVLAGTEEQKKKYLPLIASGQKICSFALSEPKAGTDAANIETTAVKDGDFYILNGNKQFITNGPIADIFTVVALTDRKLRAKGGITIFLVERGTPGFSNGPAEKKLGWHGSQTSTLTFEDCRVPAENIIGNVGEGFKLTMKTLDTGRLGIAATSLGAAKKLLHLSIDYANERVQFGQPIAKFQLIQEMIADMGTNIFATQAMLYEVAKRKDNGIDSTLDSSMVKLFASEMAWKAADQAVQIHGGAGYMKEYFVERLLRDVRLLRIFEGTSEIQKVIIASRLLKD